MHIRKTPIVCAELVMVLLPLTSTPKWGCRGEVPCRSARCPRTFLSPMAGLRPARRSMSGSKPSPLDKLIILVYYTNMIS